jgi:plasmid stabilization system protein ParE
MENKLEQIAQGVADVTLELMEDSIDWQLADFPQDGDEYSAIHSNVLQLAIKKMYLQTKHD